MNPIATLATTPAPREGAYTDARARSTPPAGAPEVVAALSDRLQTATAVRPPEAAAETQEAADKRMAEEPTRREETSESPHGAASSGSEAPRPAPPLKSFAQIPMKVVEEISRLREEAARETAQGVPGRSDPTPVPAANQAIAPAPPGSAL